MGWWRDQLASGILRPLLGKQYRNQFDGARTRRRLASWNPTAASVNTILTSQGEMLRKRCRDVMRNNAYATAGGSVFRGNLIGTGIKPSSLIADDPDLRADLMQTWQDWTDECDADGLLDFYGMQTTAAQSLFEAGECFIRFRPRRIEDGVEVPLQIQLLESEMVPYSKNEQAQNGNWIMNGIELDFRGKRVAYWMHQIHPGDVPIDAPEFAQPVRVPASEVIHMFCPTRPGQMRGVPLLTPALLRLYFLDQYDDAELERKKIAAMFAGFVTTPVAEDILPIDAEDTSAPQEGVSLTGLEPGTLQTLLPGEDIKFSEPADVGGGYEAYMFRQLTAAFIAMGVPYSIGTTDLRRANYSSLRGAIVEFRRRMEQLQHNIIVFQMCRPIWRRWMDTAVLSGALDINATEYVNDKRSFQRARWIAPRYEWVDPLKDRQAEKLAVDAGFKSRSDVVEAEGYDPEENDKRIRADKDREEELDLVFGVVNAAANQPMTPDEKEEQAQREQDAQQQAEDDAEDDANEDRPAARATRKPRAVAPAKKTA